MSYILDEIGGSPTITFDRKGGTGQRIFKVAWADRYTFLQDLLPDPFMTGTDAIIPPALTFPGIDSLDVIKVKIDPFFPQSPLGDNAFPPNYTDAKVTVDYGTTQYNQKASQFQPNGPGGKQGSTSGQGNPKSSGTGTQTKETFVTHKITTSAEFLTWPTGVLAAAAPANPSQPAAGAQVKIPEDNKFGLLMPLMEHHVTWHFVPYPPWSSIRWLIGNVNAYWFAGSPPETLLFLGCEASRDITSQGVQCWSVTYKFVEKNMNQLDPNSAFGWNHYLRTNGWNSGMFQIVNRKAPSAYTTLQKAMTDADTTATVRSRNGFPDSAQDGMYVKIDGEYVKTDGNFTTTFWQGLQRGLLDSVAAAHPIGAPVATIQASTLNASMDSFTNVLKVFPAGGNCFPSVGQFFLKVGGELMAVATRTSLDPYTFGVLRGVRGTNWGPHSGGDPVFMADSPVYPLGDFRYLFLSGLVVF